jgi:hypothetical protein
MQISKWPKKKILIINFPICHPEGIYAVVDTAFPSNCKDPYRMTL